MVLSRGYHLISIANSFSSFAFFLVLPQKEHFVMSHPMGMIIIVHVHVTFMKKILVLKIYNSQLVYTYMLFEEVGYGCTIKID